MVTRDLAFMTMDPYLRKRWDLPGQVRQKWFCQQADQPDEEDLNWDW